MVELKHGWLAKSRGSFDYGCPETTDTQAAPREGGNKRDLLLHCLVSSEAEKSAKIRIARLARLTSDSCIARSLCIQMNTFRANSSRSVLRFKVTFTSLRKSVR